VLISLAGGTDAIQQYLVAIGMKDMKVANPEREIQQNWPLQYENFATPNAAVMLLRDLNEGNGISEANRSVLLKILADTTTGPKRIKGMLPAGTTVAHKTGTSGTKNGITAATNDIGIITLPNGKHIAIAVFVSDSSADEKTREAVIAKIAKAVWDRWNSKEKNTNVTAINPITFDVNGIGLGASRSQVEAALGRPSKVKKSRIDICGVFDQILLIYPGMIVQLTPGDDSIFSVLSIEISSSNRLLPGGVRVGDNISQLTTKFGFPATRFEEKGFEILSYYTVGNDNLLFYFKNERLIKAKAYVEPC
jgi:hypothetical protein